MTKAPATWLPEAEVARQCEDVLRMFGVDFQRRNTGGMVNAQGQYVAFGEPGNSDYLLTFAGSGRIGELEVKRSNFDPRRLRGAARAHFARQLARLRRCNALGGVGLWVRCAADLASALPRLKEGWRVAIDDAGLCYLESPDEPTEATDAV